MAGITLALRDQGRTHGNNLATILEHCSYYMSTEDDGEPNLSLDKANLFITYAVDDQATIDDTGNAMHQTIISYA